MTACSFAVACQAPREPGETLNAALVQTCAPFDGPAIALFLTTQPAVPGYPEPPYAAITIYRSISNVLGQDFEVDLGTQNLGQGRVCPATGDCHSARAASVGFGGLNADSTVDIRYRLETTPDSIVTGRGRARFHPTLERCG